MRSAAPRMSTSNWSQSSLESENAKSSGIASDFQGLAWGSKPPKRRPPTSSRM
jgi:hypothetical protein